MIKDLQAKDDRQRLKGEIIGELKSYVDNAFKVKFEDAASPMIKELSSEIENLFKSF